MGAVLGDGLAGVGGAAEDADGLACADGLADAHGLLDGGEVGVEGVDLDVVDDVAKDDVDPVGGGGGLEVDVGDGAVCGGKDGVGWLSASVFLDGADVDAFMELASAGADAAELAAFPGLAGRADEELLVGLARGEQGAVGGGELEGLPAG